MKAFVCQQNIDHYRKLLGTTTDEVQRRKIESLLAAEEAALNELTLTKIVETSSSKREH
jgi:hypothetical protein